MTLRATGFLGPIGDDLPSLIPLIAALIIFFGAYGTIYRDYAEKNELLEMTIRVNRLGRDLRGSSYVTSTNEFERVCTVARSTGGLKFHAGIVKLPVRLNPNYPLAPGDSLPSGVATPVNADGSCGDPLNPDDSQVCHCTLGPDCPRIVFTDYPELGTLFLEGLVNPNDPASTTKKFECCSMDPTSPQCQSGISLSQQWPGRDPFQKPLVRFFPLAVEVEKVDPPGSTHRRFYVQPAQLVIVAWR